jgi:hypothetical protein
MADEKTLTPAEIEAANLKKAREVNEGRNQSRVSRLGEIADNNEAMRAGEMVDTPGGDIRMKEEPTAEDKEATAERESADAERALAELQAKALQEEGAAPEIAAEEEAPEGKEEEPEGEAAEEKSTDTKVVNGETYYLTVVNGTEKWLTLPQLRAAAQKVESADQYLAAAAESVRNAARLDLSGKKDEPSKVEKDDWKKVLRSVAMGDEEAISKFASAIESLQEARAKPSEVTPDVLQQIDERWSFRRAAEWFEDQYQDLLGDPVLKKLVYDKDAELAKDSPTMAYKKRLKTAGDEVRGWLQKRTGTPGVKATASETKDARKKTLVNVPSAAARQTPAADEEAEESVEDVIQKMAKARGQGRAMVHRPTHRF